MKNKVISVYRKLRFIKNVFLLNLKDAFYYVHYSNGLFDNDNKKKMQDNLIVLYHPLEKGLCMPEFKLGFGKDINGNFCGNCGTKCNGRNF